MPQPKTFLIQIYVPVNPDGSVGQKTIRSFYDRKVLNGPLGVNVGDHVGWLVQAVFGNNLKNLPYTIDLSQNPSFFGASSLSVPAGGASDFLRVLAIQDKITYKLSVPGLPPIDPDIQSGGDSTLFGALAVTNYTIYWDTANPANRMTYSSGGNPQPLPLTVKVGDKVTFQAKVAQGSVTSNFAVNFTFDVNHGWASPFNQAQGTFTSSTTTIPASGPGLPVQDSEDSEASFPFTASIVLNSQTVTSPADPGNAIVMAKTGPQPELDEDE